MKYLKYNEQDKKTLEKIMFLKSKKKTCESYWTSWNYSNFSRRVVPWYYFLKMVPWYGIYSWNGPSCSQKVGKLKPKVVVPSVYAFSCSVPCRHFRVRLRSQGRLWRRRDSSRSHRAAVAQCAALQRTLFKS